MPDEMPFLERRRPKSRENVMSGKCTNQKKWAEMEKLCPEELSAFIFENPIVFVPSGIYEWHDKHSPLGTDTLKIVEICKRTAQLTGGLIHMPSNLGVGAFFNPIHGMKHGGINFSETLVYAYLTELMEQLEHFGFELIVLFNGHTHGANIKAHEEASRNYMLRENTKAKVLCLNDCEVAVKHRYKVADHAAKWETSFMMATYPSKVHMNAIDDDHGPWHGLDPRYHASAEEGERMYDLIAKEAASLVGKAFSATRENILDNSFVGASECWEDCQNIDDLKTNFWKNDEQWEDPYCWCCRLRSAGVVDALVEIKGIAWTQHRMQHWREKAQGHAGRKQIAITELTHEMNRLGNKV